MTYDNTNRGALWGNKHKKEDKHPDFKGSANVVCLSCNQENELDIAAWKRKEGANPKAPALSIRFSEPRDPKDDSRTPPPEPKKKTDEFVDDDIPF